MLSLDAGRRRDRETSSGSFLALANSMGSDQDCSVLCEFNVALQRRSAWPLTGAFPLPIEFHCSECGKMLRTPDNSAGKKGRCPDCGTIMTIPVQSTNPSSTAQAPSTSRTTPKAKAATPPAHDPLGLGIGSPTPQNPLPSAGPGRPSTSKPVYNPYQSPGPAMGQPMRPTGQTPKTGLVLTLGIISLVSSISIYLFVCCCWPVSLLPMLVAFGCGIPAWIVGHQELKRFAAGVYRRQGQGEMKAGYVCAILGVVFSILSIVAIALLVGLGVSLGMMDEAGMLDNL
jgi:phage FluMu protein Com